MKDVKRAKKKGLEFSIHGFFVWDDMRFCKNAVWEALLGCGVAICECGGRNVQWAKIIDLGLLDILTNMISYLCSQFLR